MNPHLRRLLIFVLFALSLTPFGFLLAPYIRIYPTLEQYHVEGLVLCWLSAYGLATLCIPGFLQGTQSKHEYESSGPLAIIQRYLSMLMIMFVALAVVFSGLWCLGWMLYFIEVAVAWVFRLIFGSLTFNTQEGT